MVYKIIIYFSLMNSLARYEYENADKFRHI